MHRRRTGLTVTQPKTDECRVLLGLYPPSAASIMLWGSPAATARASMASLRACGSAGLGRLLGSASPSGMSGGTLPRQLVSAFW